jgi:hypothetical protein
MSVDKNRDLWEQAKVTAITGLYKDDPFIRASLDAQMNAPTPKPKSSVVLRDEQGNVTGVEGGSVISGKNANAKSQIELWNALKDQLTKTNKKEEVANHGE